MEFQFIVVIQTQNKNFDVVKSFEALFLFSYELSCSEENKKRSLKSFDCSIYTRFSCIQCKPLLTSLTIQYESRYTISCVAIYRETILVVEILTHRCVCGGGG